MATKAENQKLQKACEDNEIPYSKVVTKRKIVTNEETPRTFFRLYLKNGQEYSCENQAEFDKWSVGDIVGLVPVRDKDADRFAQSVSAEDITALADSA